LAVSLLYTIIANNFCPLKWALATWRSSLIRFTKWILKAWPALYLIIIFVIHQIALRSYCIDGISDFFCWSNSSINESLSFSFQIIGGLLIIYSIDNNIGLFKNKNLLSVAKEWLKSAPFIKQKTITINAQGIASAEAFGSCSVVVTKNPQTTEEHLQYLQEQIDYIKKDISSTKSGIQKDLDAMKDEYKENYSANNELIRDLRNKLETTAIGGIKVQIFGVLLMVYGSAISYFA
jgi:hypothetical protein